MARIRIYKNSIVASLLSMCGYGLVSVGTIALFSESVAEGIILVLIGVGLAFWGAKISEKKQFRTWKSKIESDGLDSRIKEDVSIAVMVYNSNPSKRSLAYISQLNPAAGNFITEKIRSNKKAILTSKQTK